MEKKEIKSILIAILLASALLMFNKNILEFNIFYIIIPTIIILLFVKSQKIAANYADTSIEITNWHMDRWWITKWAHLKKPFPAGIVFPLLLGFLSGGMIKMLSLLQFTATALPSKSVKKYGRNRRSGTLEWDDAMIAFYGLLAVMILSLISSFLPSTIFPFNDLAKYALYYLLWNLVPFGQLNGGRLFFGSRPLYIFALILTFITGMIVLI